MEMREILYPGVITALPAVRAKGGGSHGKYVSSPLVALHNCRYGPICRGEGNEAAAVPDGRLMGLALEQRRRAEDVRGS